MTIADQSPAHRERAPRMYIYCADHADFEIPYTVVKATHFRKGGDIDRRYANAEWREWLKNIGEAK